MSQDNPAVPSLDGPKILLEGPSGTGKSYSVGTLVDWAAKQSPPRRVAVIYTENSLETLLGFWRDKGQEVPSNLSWHVIRTAQLDLASLTLAAKNAGMLSYESLTKLVDPNRAAANPWERFLIVLSDVPDDRTGKKLGNVGSWTNQDILVVDSLSEAATACFKMVIGNKPVASQPDYMVAQNNLLSWLRFMTQSLKCTFVLTAHVARQVNEIIGTTQLMTKAIGRALADEIPQLFSEVIYCVKEGASWTWDTAIIGVDTKTRYLPIASKIPPNFAQIMDQWAKRGAL